MFHQAVTVLTQFPLSVCGNGIFYAAYTFHRKVRGNRATALYTEQISIS